MNARTFAEYASSPHLSADETYTVELLIDSVRRKFDPTYWNDRSERDDARSAPDYRPSFSAKHIQPAAKELENSSGVSFQRMRDNERPVRDLCALRFLPGISRLILNNNEVSDLTPLRDCVNLRTLYLYKNPIHDISPLAGCLQLEQLHVGNTPIGDFSTLQSLPRLRELSISADQVPRFKQIERLPALAKLEFDLDTFDDFERFPLMLQLRVIVKAKIRRLNGIEWFPKLENLVNFSGEADSLEPLRTLKHLTHANFLGSRVRSLKPLSELPALREIHLKTDARKLDLSPLKSISSLHEVTIKCADREPVSLAKVRSGLSSWDVEFRAKSARHSPSLELEVVDQETFDIYDTKLPFGVDESDTNEGMLQSELEWLDRQLKPVFALNYQYGDDYEIPPFHWNGARSRTIVLYSERAIQAFPKIVLSIQNVLAMSNKDWIIYLQSDNAGPEFIVWVYPQKIVVATKYADVVRSLVNGTPNSGGGCPC